MQKRHENWPIDFHTRNNDKQIVLQTRVRQFIRDKKINLIGKHVPVPNK